MRAPVFILLFAIAVTSAHADIGKDMPKRKSGLWDLSMQMDTRAQAMRMQQCVDEKSDDLMKQRADQQGAKCAQSSVTRSGNQVVVDTVCPIGGTSATTKAVFTGDFSSAYKAEIHTSFTPPMRGMKESTQTLEAKWLGPCKPGQKPGDIMMPGRPPINPAEMMKNMPKAAH